jgi:hypothetical protein
MGLGMQWGSALINNAQVFSNMILSVNTSSDKSILGRKELMISEIPLSSGH